MLGGSGTRLYPLTLFQSKALLPLVNYPLFMRMLEILARQGVQEFIFSARGIENTLQIKDAFRYGDDFSARLSLPEEARFRYQPNYPDAGSADSVRFAMEYYDIQGEVLVVEGNSIAGLPMSEMMEFHREKEAIATVVLKELSEVREGSGFETVEVDGDARITGFVGGAEQRKEAPRLIDTSIYLFSPEIREVLGKRGGEAGDLRRDVLKSLIEEGRPVYGFKCPGYWAGVETPDSLLKASLDIMAEKVEHIRMRKEHEIAERVWVHPTTLSRFRKDMPVIEGNTVIGGDCSINATAIIQNSCIGDNCIIEDGVRIQDSVVMDFVNIQRKVTLKSCIIGRYAVIGEGSVIDGESGREEAGGKEIAPVIGDGVQVVERSFLGACKRVAPITHSHRILSTGRFRDLGYDSFNIYFTEAGNG